MTASTHPPVDPELRAVLAGIPAGQRHLMRLEDILARREEQALMLPAVDDALRRGGAVELEERQIPGPAGAPDLSVLILRPAHGQGPWPGIYHTHGGGMVLGTNRTGADELALWVDEVGVVAVSVEYRLAPEHPHPAPVEDCYAGLLWTGEHCGELGIDPSRLIIAGSSAGGGLAAGTALMARDRGGPPLSHQILMCPMLDDRCITLTRPGCPRPECRPNFTSGRAGSTGSTGLPRTPRWPRRHARPGSAICAGPCRPVWAHDGLITRCNWTRPRLCVSETQHSR
jgi:acetyl esterase/lipase